MEEVQRQTPVANGVNTALQADGVTIRSALADNRELLIARNMLDRGHDRPAAEKEIDGTLKVLTNVERSSVQLAAHGRQVELSVEIKLAGTN